MPVPDRLADAAIRHQVFLERLKAGESSQFLKTAKAIDSAVRAVLYGRDDVSSMPRGRFKKLIDGLRSSISGSYSKFADEFFARLSEIAGYESGFELAALKKVISGVAVTQAEAAKVVKLMMESPLSVRGADGGKLLQPFVDDWGKKDTDMIVGAIIQGVSEGQSNSQIVQTIRGTRKNKFSDGLIRTSTRHAEAITRTAIQHASSVAREAVWLENKDIVDGLVWLSTLDGRTTTRCRSLDNVEFSLGEGPRPPIHIGCRSLMVPSVKNKSLNGGTRSSLSGYVARDETYYSWLKKQPKSFQNEAVGPNRAKLLRDGGLSTDEFSRLNLGRNFQPMTLDQMRNLEPLAFERANI